METANSPAEEPGRSPGTVGFGIGATGFIDVAGEYNKDDGTSTGRTRPIAAIFAQQFPSLASQLPNYPLPVQIWGNSPQHNWKAVINAGVNVTPNSQLYLTGLAAYNNANESFNYRPTISGSAADVAGVVHGFSPNGAFASAVLPDGLPDRHRDLPGRRIRQ